MGPELWWGMLGTVSAGIEGRLSAYGLLCLLGEVLMDRFVKDNVRWIAHRGGAA